MGRPREHACDPIGLLRLAARHRAAGNHLLADAALLRAEQGLHSADPLPVPHIPQPAARPPAPRVLLLRLASPAVVRA